MEVEDDEEEGVDGAKDDGGVDGGFLPYPWIPPPG